MPGDAAATLGWTEAGAGPGAEPETAPASRRGLSGPRLREAALRCGSVLLFFALWQGFSTLNATALHLFNPILLPGPAAVFATGIELARSGDLARDIAASLSRVFQGFAIAALAGIAAGMAVGRSRTLEHLFDPMFELLRPIPPLAFLPMMVLWFGIGEASKIAFIAYAAFFPVFTTTVEAIRHVDPLLLRAASSLGASRRDLFRHVILPAAVPGILTGLRLAFGLSFFVIVAAEFIAADSGLGYLINDARTFFLVSQMLLAAAVIGIIGFAFNLLLRRLERRLLRWREAGPR
jgi:ABC-type nitrate/sulfonate/bicarbonate transport system permease component